MCALRSTSASLVLALYPLIYAGAHAAQVNESAAPEREVTIPLELHDNFAFLVVTLNGKDVRLKFDLGNSAPLALQPHVLDAIEAAPTGELSRFQGIGGAFESRKYKVASVKMADQVFNEVVAWTDPPRAGYEPDQDSGGFLGTGLLKSYVLIIDYPRRALTLAPRSVENLPGACKGASTPFSRSPKWRGEAVTEARADVGQLTLWWDTGAPLSVLRSDVGNEPRSEGAGGVLETKQLYLGDTDFGPWRFELWDMDLPGFDGFIGYDFFAKHVVCVDYPGQRVAIAGGRAGGH